MSWKAEDYFEDPLVIKLCKAIKANDLDEIDNLVAEGANVNAIGKGNMTPLLWAFPDDHIERFRKLLEYGANPNILVTEDFGTNRSIRPGYAVTHLALRSKFQEHYKAVFDHGGDANLQTESEHGHDTPLHIMIRGTYRDKGERLRVLLDHGADVNALGLSGWTPASTAVAYFSQYSLALDLLKAGADPLKYHKDEHQTIAHFVVSDARLANEYENGLITPYGKLVKWLKAHSVDLQSARNDQDRWASLRGNRKQKRAQMDREILERKKRENRNR